MNEYEYELYDRNIRLWGKDSQQKLSNSRVLLINLNSAITELAKNLILSGISIYLYDKENENDILININDVNTNFFINEEDIGLNRVNKIADVLRNINMYVKVDIISNLNVECDCICYGFINTESLHKYEHIYNNKIPFYTLCQFNNYGFILISNKTSTKDKLIKYINQIEEINSKRINFSLLALFVVLFQEYKSDICKKVKEEKVQILINEFMKDYQNQFNSISSVISGIASQEIVKLLTNDNPTESIYSYNSKEQFGMFDNKC